MLSILEHIFLNFPPEAAPLLDTFQTLLSTPFMAPPITKTEKLIWKVQKPLGPTGPPKILALLFRPPTLPNNPYTNSMF